jgi:hypothetical protein
MANIRVNTYSPDDAPEKARAQVANTILDAGRETDLRKHLAVNKAAESLDEPSWWVLAESQSDGGIPHPQLGNAARPDRAPWLGDDARAAAIPRLLEIGALKTTYLEVTPQLYAQGSPDVALLTYESTEFGKAVYHEGVARLGLFSTELQKVVEQRSKRIAHDGDPSQKGS